MNAQLFILSFLIHILSLLFFDEIDMFSSYLPEYLPKNVVESNPLFTYVNMLHREIQNCLTVPQKRSRKIFYLFCIVVRRRRTRITNSSEKVKVSIANCRCQSILQCYSTTSLLFCGQSKLKGVCHSFELLQQNFFLRGYRFTKSKIAMM